MIEYFYNKFQICYEILWLLKEKNMNKKITSLIITLILPAMLLVGCKNNQDEFYMTEETTAMDNSVEYSANTYKEAFFSTKNFF